MLEKGKISALQMALLLYVNVISTAILIIPGITFKYAERDLWLSPIWGSLAGFLVVFIVYKLNKFYPTETLIQYSQHILGRIPGKVVGFFYLLFYLYINGQTLRQYGDFLVGAFLRHTPIILVMGCMALAIAFAVRAGLEVLARLSDFFVPIIILLWLVIVLLLIPEMNVKKMLPIMEKGITPSLFGAVVPLTWYTILFHTSTLLPFLTDREKGMKWGVFTVLAVMVTLVITNLATLFVFGGITGNFVYPVMTAARYISYADFFENLEALVMAIWISGMFIKMGLIHYVFVLNTAQWLDLSDYKPLVLPFGLVLTLFGIWSAPNLTEIAHSVQVIIPFLAITIYIFIPVILLLITVLGNRNRQKVRK